MADPEVHVQRASTDGKRCTRIRKLGSGFALVFLLACTHPEPDSRCQDRFEAKDYPRAVQVCKEEYEKSGDARPAARAARAHYELGQKDEVLVWAKRLGDSPQAASIWHLSGRIQASRGKIELAQKAFLRSLGPNLKAANHQHAAYDAIMLTKLYWQTSGYRDGIKYASVAYQSAIQAKDNPMQVIALGYLFKLLHEVGDLEGSRQVIRTAVLLLQPEQTVDRARFRANEALLLLEQDRLALARQAFEEALELVAESPDRDLLRAIHLDLVRVNLDLGAVEKAQHHVLKARQYADTQGIQAAALAYFQALVHRAQGHDRKAHTVLAKALASQPIREQAWQLEYELGCVSGNLGNHKEAKQHLGRSIAIMDQMRQELGFSEFKHWLLARKREPYEALFDLQARAGQDLAALETFERSKARTFLDTFIHTAATSDVAAGTPWEDDASIERIDSLKLLLPALTTSPAARPLGPKEILGAMGSRHLIAYFASRDRLWLLKLGQGRVGVTLLTRPLSEIDTLIRRFVAHPDDGDLAEDLGEALLPDQALPGKGSRLYVVTDGQLGRIPFSALRRDGRFLVEDYEIAYLPSASSLLLLASIPSGDYGPPVVLGNPLGDLPAADREAQQVATRLGVLAWTRKSASTLRLQDRPRASVLHLATHAGIGARGAWLRLADGDLSVDAIVRLRIQPRLVVLTSCASAARRGKGMWGALGAAFLATGSQAVLATLWSVDDKLATEFVLRFYKEGGVDDPAGALARTQRAFLAQDRAPFAWATFVLMGAASPESS